MFKLTREKYVTALQSAEDMEEVLVREREKIEKSRENLFFNWQGMQSEKTLGMVKESGESGSHAKALAYVHGMTTIMSEYLPEIEKMMAKREQIGEQLKQDEYVAPDLSHFQEEELIIDYSYIDNVKADAEGVLFYGDAAIRILREMMTEAEQYAGEYLDFSETEELLEEGERKLHRLENYRDEFIDFGKQMSDMEYNISDDLSRVLREQGETKLEISDVQAVDTMMKNKVIELKGNMNHVISQDIDLVVEKRAKLISSREILQKDPKSTNPEERFLLSQVFTEIYIIFEERIVELVADATETLNDYVKAFYEFQFSVEGQLQNIVSTDWIGIVSEGISEKYEELKIFLQELEKVPGENVKETIDNLDDMSGGKLKNIIYGIMTFCAENGIEDGVNSIYEKICPDWFRPLQKAVINYGGVKEKVSKYEDILFNDIFVHITKGLLGFNYDASTGSYYTTEGSLQNAWGFGAAIDEFAPLLGMDLYHKEFIFEADGKEYLVELWKGEYGWGITSGGEVGVYTRPIEETYDNPIEEGEENFDVFYDSAEGDERLRMITTMYDMSGKDARIICTRDTADYSEDGKDFWNLNFKSFDAVDKEDIRMEAIIEADTEIIKGITQYYDENPDKMENIEVNSEENKIKIIWYEGAEKDVETD